MGRKSSTGTNLNKSQLKFGRQPTQQQMSPNPKNSLKETQIRRFITTNTSLGYVLTMISLGINPLIVDKINKLCPLFRYLS